VRTGWPISCGLKRKQLVCAEPRGMGNFGSKRIVRRLVSSNDGDLGFGICARDVGQANACHLGFDPFYLYSAQVWENS
jgi:hypothetical protein